MHVPIYTCRLVRCGRTSYDARRKANTTTAACEMVRELVRQELEDECVEQFLIVTLDVKLKVIGVHKVTTGTLDASLVHPREVFRHALLAAASAIILVHNHPLGRS